MEAYLMSGENFLKNVFPKMNQKICYAYLDNFDWNGYEENPKDEWPDWMIEIYNKYKNLGLDLTQKNSAEVHLEQTKLILNHCADKCIIHFDDTYGDLETYHIGKGQLAVPYLRNNGWNILSSQNGSVIMANY